MVAPIHHAPATPSTPFGRGRHRSPVVVVAELALSTVLSSPARQPHLRVDSLLCSMGIIHAVALSAYLRPAAQLVRVAKQGPHGLMFKIATAMSAYRSESPLKPYADLYAPDLPEKGAGSVAVAVRCVSSPSCGCEQDVDATNWYFADQAKRQYPAEIGRSDDLVGLLPQSVDGIDALSLRV